MLDHINENLSFVEQIPDAALQMNLVSMLTMKMRCCLRSVRMMVDNPVGLSNLHLVKNALKQMIAWTIKQSIDCRFCNPCQ